LPDCPWLEDNGFFNATLAKENDPSSCFLLSEEKHDYLECVDICAVVNGTLASVGSLIDHRMLTQRTFAEYAGSSWYIGGYKSSLTDEWNWIDGSAVTYGEPILNGVNEWCLLLVGDKMHDHWCSDERRCLCSTGTTPTENVLEYRRKDIANSNSGSFSSCEIGDFSTSTCAYISVCSFSGGIQVVLLINFALSRTIFASFFKRQKSNQVIIATPSNNEDAKENNRRASIRTAVSKIYSGDDSGDVPFPFADFILIRHCFLG